MGLNMTHLEHREHDLLPVQLDPGYDEAIANLARDAWNTNFRGYTFQIRSLYTDEYSANKERLLRKYEQEFVDKWLGDDEFPFSMDASYIQTRIYQLRGNLMRIVYYSHRIALKRGEPCPILVTN